MSDPPLSDAEFASAYDAAAGRFFARIERSCDSDLAWPQRVRTAMDACLALFAKEPAVGRILVFEADARAEGIRRRHEETLNRIVDLLREGREETSASLLPDEIEEGIVGGLAFLIGRALRRGEAEDLPALTAELTILALTPYVGRAEALRIASERA